MNKVDLLFIIDVTGSMGYTIQAAKQKMQDILTQLSDQFKIDLRIGLSCYRDHPPQDSSFVTVIFNLLEIKDIKNVIGTISVDGGGDRPEAVIDGIIDGANGMSWREGSRRIAFLIGDAPAHGMVDYETCCQCGQTWGDAIFALESNKITMYSVLLSNDDDAKDNFKLLSNFTGGFLIESDDAMDTIVSTLKTEFDGLNLDSKVLELLSSSKNESEICKLLNIDRESFSTSAARIAQFS